MGFAESDSSTADAADAEADANANVSPTESSIPPAAEVGESGGGGGGETAMTRRRPPPGGANHADEAKAEAKAEAEQTKSNGRSDALVVVVGSKKKTTTKNGKKSVVDDDEAARRRTTDTTDAIVVEDDDDDVDHESDAAAATTTTTTTVEGLADANDPENGRRRSYVDAAGAGAGAGAQRLSGGGNGGDFSHEPPLSSSNVPSSSLWSPTTGSSTFSAAGFIPHAPVPIPGAYRIVGGFASPATAAGDDDDDAFAGGHGGEHDHNDAGGHGEDDDDDAEAPPVRAWRSNSGRIGINNRMPAARVNGVVVDGTVVSTAATTATAREFEPFGSSSESTGRGRGRGNDEDFCPACADKDRCECPSNKSLFPGQSACSKENRKSVLALAALLVVVIAGITVGAVFATKRGSSSPSTAASEQPPSNGSSFMPPSDRYVSIKSLLESVARAAIPEYYYDVEEDSEAAVLTPQSRAVTWLADSDARNLPLTDASALVQRYAVATLFFATGGKDTWTRDLGFLSESHECDWNERVEEYYNWPKWHMDAFPAQVDMWGLSGEDEKGVFCSEEGVVDKLWLVGNHLNGTLPEEVGLLTSLNDLLFSTNDVAGELPSSLRHLSKLERLAGSFNNDLNGAVPSWLGDLTALREVRFDGTPLEGTLPDSITELTALEVLDFGPACRLSGTIPQFGSGSDGMPHLRHLSLDFCDLTGTIPASIFSGLPELSHLFLTENSLTGSIPSNVGDATNLEMLLLGVVDPGDVHSDLTGSIPPSLFELTNLLYLDLLGNRLNSTLSKDFGKLDKLQVLYLADNEFTGTVPESFGLLTNLELLSISAVRLHGDIDFLCDMSPVPMSFADCLVGSDERGGGAPALVDCPCCTYCCNQDMFEAAEGFFGCFPND